MDRTGFLREVLEGVHEVWPKDKPIILRISASDYMEGGMDIKEMIRIIDIVKSLIDMVHVSSGGVVPASFQTYPGYQITFAEEIRKNCGIPVITVGLITKPDMAEEILMNERADLVALGRELLRNPYWTVNEAVSKKIEGYVPKPYERGFL